MRDYWENVKIPEPDRFGFITFYPPGGQYVVGEERVEKFLKKMIASFRPMEKPRKTQMKPSKRASRDLLAHLNDADKRMLTDLIEWRTYR